MAVSVAIKQIKHEEIPIKHRSIVSDREAPIVGSVLARRKAWKASKDD